MPNAPAGELLLAEYLTPSDQILHSVTNVVVDRQTPFQRLKIVESPSFGRALLLDGTWQSCTGDEFIYHEALVHQALLHHIDTEPKAVLILGGGEGATAREVLRWPHVHRVVMVDIDRDVVNACREHLPTMHAGAFDDPRLQLMIGDALELLDNTDERFDIVLSDLSDPLEEGPSFRLFTREYFNRVRRVLSPSGIVVVQAGSIGPVEARVHARLHRTVASCFGHVTTYGAWVPSFGTPWGFVMASDTSLQMQSDQLKTRLQTLRGDLRWLSPEIATASRAIPPYLQAALNDTSLKPYTLDEPPRFGHIDPSS